MEYKELARFQEDNGTLLFEDITIRGKLEKLRITRRNGSFITVIEYNSKTGILATATEDQEIRYLSNKRFIKGVSRENLYKNIQLLNRTLGAPIEMLVTDITSPSEKGVVVKVR